MWFASSVTIVLKSEKRERKTKIYGRHKKRTFILNKKKGFHKRLEIIKYTCINQNNLLDI